MTGVKMSGISVVIFDWSGTISDDLDVVIEAINRLLKRLGIATTISKDYLRKNYTPDYMDFYKALGVKATRAEVNRLYREEFLKSPTGPSILDNAKKTLEWLHSKGKKIFVVSTHPPELLEKESRDYGVAHLINKIYADAISKEVAIKEIVGACGADKKNVIFVGDTFVDIDAGHAAGVKTVAVLTGYQDEETLKKHKPDFIMKGVGGLREIIS